MTREMKVCPGCKTVQKQGVVCPICKCPVWPNQERRSLLVVDCPKYSEPTYGSSEAAGLDLKSAESIYIHPGEVQSINTGVKACIMKGCEGQVRGRSGLAFKHNIFVPHVGTIDSDYRGEIRVLLENKGTESYHIKKGDRIAQLIISPVCRCAVVQGDLPKSGRGIKGFGSSGR